ncbi:MAG: hypothetical protein GY862_38185 [Gammaproteobacteria bacterium]|nr:hypothetical protein [Gammaproteobacteria bacterium]
MAEFEPSGSRKRDCWLVNDSIDWAVIPSGTIDGFCQDMPVRLQIGDPSWGQRHIENKHGHWLRKLGKSVAEVLYIKLGQPGQIYSTEQGNKIKIIMRINPDSLLILRHAHQKNTNFFTVTSLYKYNGHLDGENIGRYLSRFRV